MSIRLATAAGPQNTGFANTTALNVGATFAAAKSLNIGANLWYLMATEKVPNVKTGSGTTNNIGTELDVNIAWQLYQNVSWNWDLGYFDPGDGMGKDAATAPGRARLQVLKYAHHAGAHSIIRTNPGGQSSGVFLVQHEKTCS